MMYMLQKSRSAFFLRLSKCGGHALGTVLKVTNTDKGVV